MRARKATTGSAVPDVDRSDHWELKRLLVSLAYHRGDAIPSEITLCFMA